jgi:hypothetical protein
VPPTTTPTASAPLYTAGSPHHLDAAYRPLLPGTVAVPTSDRVRTSTAGYSCSPYSDPSTLSLDGITPPGHVTRWWVRQGYDGLGQHGYAPYFPYPYTGPAPCEFDSETQDDRFPLPHTRERQMQGMGLRQMPTPAASQGPAMRLRQLPTPAGSQARHLGRVRYCYLGRARCRFLVRVKCQIFFFWGGVVDPL